MKLKKLMCLLLVIAMIFSLAACGDSYEGTPAEATTEDLDLPEEKEITAEDISVLWDDSHVYGGTSLGKYDTITTYAVNGYEDVPFITARDYLYLLFEGKERVSVEDGVMKIEINGTEAGIDPEGDTIYIENPSRLRSVGAVDGGFLSKEEFDVITPSSKNESTQTEAKSLTISLKDYHMPVLAFEDDILMPFLALQNTFGGLTMQNVLAYNGKDYYNVQNVIYSTTEETSGDNGEDNSEQVDTPYAKALLSGPFSKKETVGKTYANYSYYATCLLLDLTYGHKEEKNITTFDKYFTRLNVKKSLKATTPSQVFATELIIFNYLFDSGHDSVTSEATVFKNAAEADEKDTEQAVEDISN
jgi:hypothetical protein